MRKFFSKSQSFILIALLLIIIAGFTYRNMAYSFENDWYDLQYTDYQKHPDEYTVQETTIKETRFINGSSYAPITVFDFYKVAVVEVTYAGGQTETYFTSARPSEKADDKIKVAYDVRYDTKYEEMFRTNHASDDFYLVIPRTESVINHTVSNIAVAVVITAFVAEAICAFVFYRKNQESSF